jgi:hypothetical protein
LTARTSADLLTIIRQIFDRHRTKLKAQADDFCERYATMLPTKAQWLHPHRIMTMATDGSSAELMNRNVQMNHTSVMEFLRCNSISSARATGHNVLLASQPGERP